MSVRFIFLLLISCCLASCSHIPSSIAYQEQYSYLQTDLSHTNTMQESDYFLIILVDARHLDYSNFCSLLKTMAKHPSDGSKNGDVGHAWIYLKGFFNGQPFMFEGGQSGELGDETPKYLEGVMNYIEGGTEPNPIRFMWEKRHDGFFQRGSGGHYPTFAAKIDLTQEQFQAIFKLVHPSYRDYRTYFLHGKQCTSLAIEAAKIAGLDLECCVDIPIAQKVYSGKSCYTLWRDPEYAVLSIPTPDILESKLVKAVSEGKAEYALGWYLERYQSQGNSLWEEVKLFPSRWARYWFSSSLQQVD